MSQDPGFRRRSGPQAVDPDVRRARTLPPEFFQEPAYARQREVLFPRTWQVHPAPPVAPGPGRLEPWTMLPGCLDEPLLLARDGGGALRCLSNVCTHRGNLLVREPCEGRRIRCGYHGRQFGLDGAFQSMPGFEEVRDFPGPQDHLPEVPCEAWGPLVFACLDPPASLEEFLAPARARVGWLPVEEFRFDPGTSRGYEVPANWALYCDNYLEGFHIPFVHPGLSRVLDSGAYRTDLLPHGVLQTGIARQGEASPAFELPAGHPDRGTAVAAWYLWLFPNTMLNFYPWGLSVNVVLPQGPDRCRVEFLSYLWRPVLRTAGAGASLHEVELQDEAVVAQVQRGLRSRLYRGGRYSPAHEQGVHHFHRLLAAALA